MEVIIIRDFWITLYFGGIFLFGFFSLVVGLLLAEVNPSETSAILFKTMLPWMIIVGLTVYAYKTLLKRVTSVTNEPILSKGIVTPIDNYTSIKGFLGFTENYLFFLPFSFRTQPLILNKKYVKSFSSDTHGTGVYNVNINHSFGRISEEKRVIFSFVAVKEVGNYRNYAFQTSVSGWNRLIKGESGSSSKQKDHRRKPENHL